MKDRRVPTFDVSYVDSEKEEEYYIMLLDEVEEAHEPPASQLCSGIIARMAPDKGLRAITLVMAWQLVVASCFRRDLSGWLGPDTTFE
jgi:hypothetical protein